MREPIDKDDIKIRHLSFIKNMLKKFITFTFFLFVLIWFAFFSIKNNLLDYGLERLPEIEKSFTDGVNDIEKKIYNPPPLVGKENISDSFLTKAGVLKWTNIQRDETESLPPLLQNSKLDAIAAERLEDMFEKQYFEHISPDGIGASDVAQKIGYEFISIGENIALGNFKDDQALVQAWMDSPGHRANILNGSYAEIGIAAGKGVYENQETWIGVQIFARPLSACPNPDQSLKAEIENAQNQITAFENQAAALRNELEKINLRNKKGVEAYNQKVDGYNALVKEINDLIKKQKNLISEYNNQVDSQNECIQK